MSLGESSLTDAKSRGKSRVMCFGTFDLFHPGHQYYLTEASKMGDALIVVIARDERVLEKKKRLPLDPETKRLENVQSNFPQALVVLGDEHDIFAPIRTYQPDMLVFGYDQRVPEERLHELFPGISTARIGGFEPETWKSSKLRYELKKSSVFNSN